MRLFGFIVVICILLTIRSFWVKRGGFGKSPSFPQVTQMIQGTKPAPGKPTVVEFWATWCPPCVQSIPHLNQLYAKYGSAIQFVGMTSEDAATVQKFTRTNPIRYPVGYDVGNALASEYGVRGIPRAFVFDADGKVIYDGHPLQLNEAVLQKLIPKSL